MDVIANFYLLSDHFLGSIFFFMFLLPVRNIYHVQSTESGLAMFQIMVLMLVLAQALAEWHP